MPGQAHPLLGEVSKPRSIYCRSRYLPFTPVTTHYGMTPHLFANDLVLGEVGILVRAATVRDCAGGG